MKTKIAVPVETGKLCAHFGHCESFYIADTEDGKITDENEIVPPEHEPGLYPKWINGQGVSCIIAGGMGGKARMLLKEENIKVVISAESKTPRELVEDYLKGSLAIGENSCNHDR
ncbi:MAG: NifB/NifX family molybdenum-iron cluster-binding protein [Bacteroidales bacterium]|jgi:predicted Fe-Mo cluster-binding NifX family protein|nr:NifB/NifX family molybdenum-iron cluster-binding protein [Bacteroidales bacterium]MCI1784829.1 NifB/NifX family molybdenum-iron cluster-binding protein [Bacteroidales bacterium]